MTQLSQLSPKEKAKTGMILIKTAISQILSENTDRWLGRNQIEESLGLWSEYGSGTYGAVASMFLDELVKEGDVVAQRQPDGRTWLYRSAASPMASAI
jgi:hypothetical protein